MKNNIAALIFLVCPLAFAETNVWPLNNRYTEANCQDGKASGFGCDRIHLKSAVNIGRSGIEAQSASDVWGWVDPVSKREIAIFGLSNKTAFVDVTDPRNPIHVGDLPASGASNLWRDIETYKNYAFIVSEAYDHGLQIFDLRQVLQVPMEKAPAVFKESLLYTGFGSAHTITINEQSGYAYASGSNTCDGGLHVLNIKDPLYPKFSTCIGRGIYENLPSFLDGGDSYTHDVLCVNYRGPDLSFKGREICVASNENTLNIVDVTDKRNPHQVSVLTYNEVGYTHQGWFTENHQYFLLGDEFDEVSQDAKTRALVFDLSNLKAPKLKMIYNHPTRAIDHNLYIKGNKAYCANYTTGLRILDLTNIDAGQITEAGSFDSFPFHDLPEMLGVWSVYPFFPSGNILMADMFGMLFVVHP